VSRSGSFRSCSDLERKFSYELSNSSLDLCSLHTREPLESIKFAEKRFSSCAKLRGAIRSFSLIREDREKIKKEIANVKRFRWRFEVNFAGWKCFKGVGNEDRVKV
jgi:hypothetical protein